MTKNSMEKIDGIAAAVRKLLANEKEVHITITKDSNKNEIVFSVNPVKIYKIG